jgi:sterol desaturase/sphingolipid hydroxylase (fatty acid hydroxylase superfamily)
VYKFVHKKHHRFNYSIGIAAEYAHPIEDILCNIIPTFAGCLLMGSHVITLWPWFGLRLLETIETHSGYNFNCSPTKFLPFLNGAIRHDFHHSHNTGSFGAMTPFWDYVMGTDRNFKEYMEERQQFCLSGTRQKIN